MEYRGTTSISLHLLSYLLLHFLTKTRHFALKKDIDCNNVMATHRELDYDVCVVPFASNIKNWLFLVMNITFKKFEQIMLVDDAKINVNIFNPTLVSIPEWGSIQC